MIYDFKKNCEVRVFTYSAHDNNAIPNIKALEVLSCRYGDVYRDYDEFLDVCRHYHIEESYFSFNGTIEAFVDALNKGEIDNEDLVYYYYVAV